MKTKSQLYDELNKFFSSGKNLLKHFHLESFNVSKELIDEINQDYQTSTEIKSLFKFHLNVEQFAKKVDGYLNELRVLIFDKIDNPINAKEKCDFIFKENQNLYYLFKRLNSKFKEVNIEFTKENMDFFLLINNVQKIPLSRDSVKPIFKLITDYLDKQKIDVSKIDDCGKILIQGFGYNVYTKLAEINNEIYSKFANELSMFYAVKEEGIFKILSPISSKSEIGKIHQNDKEKFLIDIWEEDKQGSKDYYNEVIERLQKDFYCIDSPFITKKNNMLYWSKYPTKGHISYLAGFINTCVKKKWINNFSAPKISAILINTFNFEKLDTTIFRNILSFDKEEYCKPFDFIKENK
jgi:hypothetical protein